MTTPAASSAATTSPVASQAWGQQAQTAADEACRCHDLARAKGATPEHMAARQKVIRTFFGLHLPEKPPAEVEAYLQNVDLRQPVQVVNAAGVDTNAPASGGILGLGRKPQYLVSPRFPPTSPGDPIYALKSFPAKT